MPFLPVIRVLIGGMDISDGCSHISGTYVQLLYAQVRAPSMRYSSHAALGRKWWTSGQLWHVLSFVALDEHSNEIHERGEGMCFILANAVEQ